MWKYSTRLACRLQGFVYHFLSAKLHFPFISNNLQSFLHRLLRIRCENLNSSGLFSNSVMKERAMIPADVVKTFITALQAAGEIEEQG
jgi:hypothetical protein